jgi:hypothetical protein
MQPDFTLFFQKYADAFNRSLGDTVDSETIAAAFSNCFVSANPSGVKCGQNDDEFRQALPKMYAFYKEVGTKKMIMRGVTPTPIDEHHHMVRVDWTADYQKKNGEAVSISFNVTYLLQTRDGQSRIFAFITGDEMGVLKQHGLI